MTEPEAQADNADTVGSRWPELLVALFLMLLAVLVLADSWRVGIGWAEDGPRSGYFPFFIGLGLLGASGWTAIKQLLRWRGADEMFAERGQLLSVWSVLWPMAVYIGAIAWLGIYVASVLLIAYFMRRHGKHALALTAGVSVGVPVAFYLVFERWFLVPLPKGPLEALIGL